MTENTQNKNFALITGASSGIGLNLATQLAKENHNLILVARNEKKLNELKNSLSEKYCIEVLVKPCDLSSRQETEKLCVDLQNYKINFLANNAGFGDFGNFSETSLEKEINMIQVNITSLTMISKAVLKNMISEKNGKILNIASTASFQPGPGMAVYYATKAYVLSFSEALAEELSGSGITVTAYCPGPTESGFLDAAELHDSKLFKRKLPTSEEVAVDAVQKTKKGKRVAIHGCRNWIMAQSIRFTPRSLVTKIVKNVQARE